MSRPLIPPPTAFRQWGWQWIGRRDLIITAALSCLSLLVILNDVSALARVIGGLLLALILPGYAVTEAVFGGRIRTATERTLLCVGLSLVVTVLAGLILNLAPGRMDTVAWTSLLAAFTIGSCILAATRRHGVPSPMTPLAWLRRLPWTPTVVGLLVLAIVLTGTALGLSISSAHQDDMSGQSLALWLQPRYEGSTAHVKVAMTAGSQRQSGLILIVREDNHIVRRFIVPDLDQGATWSANVLVPSRIGRQLAASLYAKEGGRPIRHVLLWLQSAKARR